MGGIYEKFFANFRLLPWVLGAALATLALQIQAGIPAPLKREHPRIFLDAQHVAILRAKLPQEVAFPSKGSLYLVMTPRRPVEGEPDRLAIFDDWSDKRNHIFLRHIRSYDRLDAPLPTIGLQLAVQAVNQSSYLAVAQLDLPVDQPVRLRVRWDSTNHKVDYSVDGVVQSLAWRLVDGVPMSWSPDGQLISLQGGFGEDISEFKLTDEANGAVVADYSGLDHSLLRQWRNTENLANDYAGILNFCALPNDPMSCGRPATLIGAENSLSHPNTLQDIAQVLAFSYLITGQAKYRTAALNYASQLLATPLGEGGEFYMRGRVVAMGIIYDWLYPTVSMTLLPGGAGNKYAQALAEGIKNTIAAPSASGTYGALATYICGWQAIKTSPLDCAERPMIEGWDPTQHANVPSIAPYYISGHHRTAVAGIAIGLAAIAGEHPSVVPMLNLAYDHFDKGFNKARNWIGQNGGTQLGWSYGSNSLDPLELWRTALDWNGTPMPPPEHARHAFLFYLYGARGLSRAVFPAVGDNFVVNWDESIAGAALYGARYGAQNEAPAARWLYDQHIAPARRSGGLRDMLLWSSDAVEAASPDELQLPLSRHFKISGNVVARDSWDYKSATLAEFHSASFASENHQHFDQNSFSLFYKAPLLLDSGVYDFYGSEHWWNYYTRSVAHNTAVIVDPLEYFSYSGRNYSNDGGQWLEASVARYPTLEQAQAGVNRLDGILRYEEGDYYSYAVGDASKAYASNKLERDGGFVRQFFFLRNSDFWPKPIVVTYDQIRVVDGKEILPKTILLHTANEPVVAGDSFQHVGVVEIPLVNGRPPVLEINNGAGMAFVQTLLPENPQMRKIGGVSQEGVSYRYSVRSPQSGNYTNYAPVNYGTGKVMTEVELSKVDDSGSWRTEIADSAGAKEARFLNVISVADAGATTPPEVARLSSDSMTEAIRLGPIGQSLVLMLPKKPPQVEFHGVRISNPRATRYLIAGLAPSQYYSVSISPVAGDADSYVRVERSNASSPYRSSPNGLLSIDRLLH